MLINVHRRLLSRLLASWLLISLTIGGGIFWYEINKINGRLVDLAISESSKISGDQLSMIDAESIKGSPIERMVSGFVQDRFVRMAIYDRYHDLLIEETNHNFPSIADDLNRYTKRFPQDKSYHYSRFSLGEDRVVQIMKPLRNSSGVIMGYFEGIFLIDRATLKQLHHDLVLSLLINLAIVLICAIAFYPVVFSLIRDVVHFSHDLLHGNIELMQVLGSAIAKRDSDTNLHNYRVTIYAARLAESVGLYKEGIRKLIAGAFLHDVGKIGISDNILLKPEKLTADEIAVMRRHVPLGVDILAKSDWLQTARDVVEYHHERMDGSGYMLGLSGMEIPIKARIFTIVDVFDALTSRRPYKEPLPYGEAVAILRQKAGTHFDPQLLSTFLSIIEPLYNEISIANEAQLESHMKSLITMYFFQRESMTPINELKYKIFDRIIGHKDK